MIKKYIVYKKKNHITMFIFGILKDNGDVYGIIEFRTVEELEKYITQYDREEILFAIELEKER